MRKIVYEQGEPKRVEIDGISGKDLSDDLFRGIFFYEFPDYAPQFKSSHTFEPNNIDSSHDLNFPYESLPFSENPIYVIKNGIPVFSHERNILYLIGSPDKARRVLFNFSRIKTQAKLIACDEHDGESAKFRDIVMNGRNYRNPFTIKRLDEMVAVKDDYVCEVDYDGFLFGKDINFFLEEGLAIGHKNRFLVSEKYVSNVLDKIRLLGKGEPIVYSSGRDKYEGLTRSFYKEMNKKLDDIFRRERKWKIKWMTW